MFASPTFTGTVSGVTAAHVGLGNVTNESKATMFASPTFSGTVAAFSSATHTLTASSNLVFTGSSSGTVTFQAGTTPAAQTYTLPAAYPGVSGYALVSTTGGVLSWASAGGTTTNALTIGTGLTLDTGSTFNGSAAVTVSLAASGVSAATYGTSTAIPQINVDTYGRITSVTSVAISAGTTLPSQTGNAGKYLTTNGTALSWATVSVGGTSITWNANTTMGGTIPVISSPTGYGTSGNRIVVVVVGISCSSSNFTVTSGVASFTTVTGTNSTNMGIYSAQTGASMGSTITVNLSAYSNYAMAYAYITTGNSSNGIGGGTASSPTTSVSVPSAAGATLNPVIVAVSNNSSLNLSTAASNATGGGPTWGSASGYAHPNAAGSLSAAVWVGTGTWNTSATINVTSNPSSVTIYASGIASS